MQSFTVEQYRDAGCWQFEVPAMALGLHAYTRGRMCEGCPRYEGGRCPALRRMLSPVSVIQSSGETVRQEAARLGIGVNEVRRRRMASANS